MAQPVKQSALRHPFTAIFGARAHVITLRELFQHGGDLSAPMLVRRTGLAKASVRNALIALQDIRVVESLGVGRATLYRATRKHPLASSIAALFKAEERRFEAKTNAIADLAMRTQGIIAVWLYGSVARNQDEPASDVDVAVVASSAPEVEAKIRDDLREAEDKFAFTASVIALDIDDVLRLEASRDPWWKSLTSEAFVIHGVRPDALTSRLKHKPPRRTNSS